MNELPNTRNASAGEDGLGEVAEAARLAFIYGFPIYEMARLRYRAFTKGDSPARPNIFRHGRQLIFPGTTAPPATTSIRSTPARGWIFRAAPS